ncbi:membrane anchor subunit of succinate dehydrogenase, Sdh4 [Gaertneriomyces sp. JEL0708]|nr:membrane anchor subunit of succinate dehydrogenase, Sdh4 [Gaertneriomyces sp. JEL0708]
MLSSRVLCTVARPGLSVPKASAVALRASPVAAFHAARPVLVRKSSPLRDAASPASEATTYSGEPISKVHGSYHWDLERALAVATVPLLIAPFIVGSNPYVDLGLGVVIPLHTHMGFQVIVDDYLPKRRTPILYRVSTGLVYGATGLVLYGCYQFNTNDIGITEFVKRLWTGKQ